MPSVQEIRNQYPQYQDMTDMQIVRGLHEKYYSDIPLGTFARELGVLDQPYDPETEGPSSDVFQARKRGSVFTQPEEYRAMLEGAGKFFTDIGLGASQLFGFATPEDAKAKAELDKPLMETPGARVGQVGAGALSTVPLMAIPGANTVPGSAVIGGTIGAVQPAESTSERVVNTTVGAGLGAGTQYLGRKLSELVARATLNSQATAAQRQDAVRALRPVVQRARQNGYVVTPSETNPTFVNQVLSRVSGKTLTQQQAAYRNQAITNRLVENDLRQSIGRAIGVRPRRLPLTREALQDIRGSAGMIYRQVGSSIDDFVPDQQYLNAIDDIQAGRQTVSKSFDTGSDDAVSRLVGTMRNPVNGRIAPDSAVEQIKNLRASASSNFRAANTGANPEAINLAHAQRDAANALEELLIRRLKSSGQEQLANQFNEARTLIAKTHTVENALNGSTQNVNARALARDLAKGRPLSGGIAEAAEFAEAFPKYANEVLEAVPPFSTPDVMLSGGASLATGNPAPLAVPAARAGARGVVLSPSYQNRNAIPTDVGRQNVLLPLASRASRALPIAGRAAAPFATDLVEQ